MGAVVGGLYASGMTPAELELVVADMNWAEALKDEPARSDLRFRRKEDEQRFPINPDMGLDSNGVKLPLGLIQGQRLDKVGKFIENFSYISGYRSIGIKSRPNENRLRTPFVSDG